MKYKRIIVSKCGGSENLQLIEEEIPEPRSGEVRIKILTAGVSLADILMRECVHPESLFKRGPFSLGVTQRSNFLVLRPFFLPCGIVINGQYI